MDHVLLGLSVPYLLALVIYGARGLRASLRMLIAAPIFMAVGALWASAPDIPRLFGLHDLYNRMNLDPRCNIFMWHYSIDRIEVDSPWYAVVFVLVGASMLFAAWRELRIRERQEYDA